MKVLGIPLYDLGMKEAVRHVTEICGQSPEKSNRCISATGAHGLITAKEDKVFAEILNSFYMNLPDGKPGAIVGCLKGARQMEQCTGPDFFRNIMVSTAGTEIRHYFCGGKEEVADELKSACEKNFNNHKIVGTFCPPFRKLSDDEFKDLGEELNSRDVRVARFHNVFGPEGTWQGGKEKAPAAICRKVVTADDNGEEEIWGDGKQTRSFLYNDECLQGVRRLMDSPDFRGPVNIGSEEMVTINQLAEIAIKISWKRMTLKHIEGPLGVRGRNSDNKLIKEKLNWAPSQPLEVGLAKTYSSI